MIAPEPVPGRAVRRLRRRYAWLMLALAVPALAAAVYALTLQYELLEAAAQRQLAMSTERSVAQLDAVLGRMREDLSRLAVTARAQGFVTRDVQADKQALAPTAQGACALDALPALLRDVAPQVILVGAGWGDAQRRHAAVERAALFAEQAQLAMLRGGRFSRVTYVDVEAGEVWIYPWLASASWLGELSAADPQQALRSLAAQAGRPGERSAPIEGDVRWRVRAPGQPLVSVTMRLPGGEPRLLAAEVPRGAFDGVASAAAGARRFWVVDGEGQVVTDRVAPGRAPSVIAAALPPQFAREHVAAALAAPLAQPIGEALLSARASAVAPWVALQAGDRADLRRRLLLEMAPHIAAGGLLLLLFLATGIVLWRRFGEPSLRLVEYLRRQAADERAPEPRVPADWAPWLHLTRDTFAAWRDAAAREQRSEMLKSAIVDHALTAVVTTDAQGVVVEFNPTAQRMFSRTRAEIIGRQAGGTIVPERVRDAYFDDLRRMRRGEVPQMIGRRVELTALRPDGSEFPVEVLLWPTQVGNETFITASLVDISERRAAAEEIARQREALRQAEKLAAMGSLLAGVAHELNNPLAIVMGRASLLEDKCSDPALRADAVRIREAAERCGRIVRSFLAMARSRPAARTAVQLNDLVRGAVDLLQYGLRTSGIELEQQLQPDLPPLLADGDKLGQVLLNLIVNAQQALAQAEPPRRLRIETGSDAQRVWLRVADNGVGVREHDRHRIFDAFMTTKAEGAGTGLGLAVARAVAIEHGGTLRLEAQSPFGRGACFRLELPLRAADAGEAQAVAQGAPHEAAVAGRVLVVDDEPEVASMMRDALEAEGYEVVSAESGAVALALLDEGRFDAVVSDLRMPDIDGRALWRAIRERDRTLAARFVFVTGDTLSPLASDFRRESGVEGLEKPFTPADLVQRVRRCMDRAR
ncbi:MAG: response regulator [Burkholderiaceae bacterium]